MRLRVGLTLNIIEMFYIILNVYENIYYNFPRKSFTAIVSSLISKSFWKDFLIK